MQRSNRWRTSPPLGLAGLAAWLLACTPAAAPDEVVSRLRRIERPNVVLIVVDTLRADRIAPYGAPDRSSPELARWGRRGIVFERALAQSSWTKVSMASLLTSLWPRTHGVRETTDGLAEGALTVAEVFREAGYRSYAVQSNGWLEQTFGFHQGFDRYMFPRGGALRGMKPMVWPHADNVYLETERLLEAHDPGQPFFLYLHFMDVHEYAAPPEFADFGSDDEGAYRAAVAWTDEVIERLRRKLDADGLLARTVLVLASDHGEAFGENGVRGHARNVLTPVLHVPLVIRLPFPVEPPVRVASQVRNLDVAPTLLDLAGLAVPERFEGESLLPLVGAAEALDRPSFASLTALLYRDATLQDSMNDGAWTYARNTGNDDRRFLFDRRVDPDENVNLAALEPARREAMQRRLERHFARAPQDDAAQSDVRIHPGLAERLRALGYAQ